MSNLKILKFIHYSLAFLWIYQGIFPKLLFTSQDEIAMWQAIGISADMAKLCGQAGGVAEIIFGLLFVIFPHKILHYLNILGMFGLFILATFTLPQTLIAAFNPVVMNIAMASLSIIALMLLKQKESY